MKVVEDLLKLAEEISMLRNELKRKEAEFAAILGKSQISKASLTRSAEQELPSSSAGQMKALLQSEPGRVFTIAEIAKVVKGTKITTLRSTMGRLAREHKKTQIRCVGHGMYKYLPEDSK